MDRSPLAKAHRGLMTVVALAIAGSLLGLLSGLTSGYEFALVAVCLAFSVGLLAVLAFQRIERMHVIAPVGTAFYTTYLALGFAAVALGGDNPANAFVYLIWFFPLLAFNKFVNPLETARRLAVPLWVGPIALVIVFIVPLAERLPEDMVGWLAVYCLAYAATGWMLNSVSSYREQMLIERERAERFRNASEILDSITDCFLSLDAELNLLFLNDAAREELHADPRTGADAPLATAVPTFASSAILGHLRGALDRRQGGRFEARGLDDQWYEIRCFPRAGGLAVYFRNVTEQKQVDALLREREERLVEQAALIDQARDAIIVRDTEHRIRLWNRGAEQLYGWRAAEVIGKTSRDLLYAEKGPFEAASAAVLDHGEWIGHLAQRRRDGTELIVEAHWTLVSDEAGRPKSILAINTDITQRLAMEAQLGQSQRLESIGHLTGGVAHDFNNLLTVILGNAELLVEALGDRPPLRALAEMTQSAASRGAELTYRLLAYARRQALEPRDTDVNALVDDLHALVRRTVSEDVEIALSKAPDLWQAQVDPGQLEGALLNLCLNARDALPGGGRLTIETSNISLDEAYASRQAELEAGDYVVVAVSDNGTGIPAEHLARVFDPFFTTKDVGKGTGLGLSMVYGFVKQSHGHVTIYSEAGFGTVVRLYLPRAESSVEPVPTVRSLTGSSGGSETILIVEDDDLVRAHVERQLAGLGYRVLVAAQGAEALAVLQGPEGDAVDLLFTDVIMPGGMNGRELAEAARQARPDLRVLYTSGYTEDAMVHHGRLESGIQLLHKPYRRSELAAKVRAVLTGEA